MFSENILVKSVFTNKSLIKAIKMKGTDCLKNNMISTVRINYILLNTFPPGLIWDQADLTRADLTQADLTQGRVDPHSRGIGKNYP